MDDPYQIFYDEADAMDSDSTTSPKYKGAYVPGENGDASNGADPYQQFYDEADKLNQEPKQPEPDTPYTDRALTAMERLQRSKRGLPDARSIRVPTQQQPVPGQATTDWTTGVGHIDGLADTTPGGRADQIPGSGEPPFDQTWPQELTPILGDIWKKGVRESTRAGLSLTPLGPASLIPGPVGKVSRGLIEGGSELSAGFFGDTDNLAIIAATEGLGLLPKMGATIAGKGVSAYFSYEMYKNLPERWKQFKEEKDLTKKTAIATQAIGELLFATQAAKHAATPGMPGGVARDLRKYDKAQEEAAAAGAQPEIPGAPAVPGGPAGPRFRSTVLPGGGETSAEQPGVTQVQTSPVTQRKQEGTGGAGQATGSGDNAGGKTEGEGEQGGVSSPQGPVKVRDKITYAKGEGVTWEVKGSNKLTTRIYNPQTHNTVVLQNTDLQRKIDSGNIVHEPAEAPPAPEAKTEAVPDWVKHNVEQLAAPLEKTGVADKIEELAAQRLTASQIAQRLNVDPHQVSAVRMKRGIPSMEDRPGFEAWLKDRQAKAEPAPVAETPVVETTTPAKPLLPMGPKEEPPRVRPPVKTEPPVEQPAEEPAEEPATEPEPGTEAPGVTKREKEIAKAAAEHVAIGVPQDHAITMETHPIDRGLVDPDRIKQQMALDKIEKSKATAAAQERADRIKADAEAKAKADEEAKAAAEEAARPKGLTKKERKRLFTLDQKQEAGKKLTRSERKEAHDLRSKKRVVTNEESAALLKKITEHYKDYFNKHEVEAMWRSELNKWELTGEEPKEFPPIEKPDREPFTFEEKAGVKPAITSKELKDAGIDEGKVEASYSADKISEGKIKKPIKIGDKLYVSTGMGWEGDYPDGTRTHHLVEVIPAEKFKGPTTNYGDKVYRHPDEPPSKFGKDLPSSGEAARRDPNGFYYGMKVKHGGKDYVMGRPFEKPGGKFDKPFQVAEHRGYQIARYRKPDGTVRMMIEKDGRTIGEVKENQFFDAKNRVDQMIKAKEITHVPGEPEAPIVELDRVARQLFKKGYNDLGPVQQEQVRNSPQYFHGPDYEELQKISQELFKKDIGKLGPKSMERKMVDAELRRRKGEPEKVAYKADDLVQYKVNGVVQKTTGVIDKVLEDGRLVVQPVGGGDTHTIRPEDVVSHRPHVEPKPVKMPRAKTSGVLRSRQTASGWEYTKGGYKVTTIELPNGSISARLFKGKTLKGSKVVGSDAEAAVWARENLNNPEAATHEVTPEHLREKSSSPLVNRVEESKRSSWDIQNDIDKATKDLYDMPEGKRGPIRAKLKALEKELADYLNPDKLSTRLETPDELKALNKISQEKFGKDYDKLGVRQKAKVDAAYDSPNLPMKTRKGYSLDPKTKREYHFSDERRGSVTPIEGSNAFKDANAIFSIHNGITLEAVDPSFVPESGADPRSGELGPVDKAYQIARVLDRPIGWYRGPATLGAFYWKGELFFNIDMLRDQDPLHITAGHEISHWIQFERPKMYRALYNELTSRAGTKGYKDYLAALEARAKGVYNEAEKKHEVVAEFVADVLKDGANFTEALGKNPSLMQRVGRSVRDWIDKTLRKLGINRERPGWGDIRGVAGDLTKARSMVMDMLKEARETKVPSKQDMNYPALSVRGELPRDRETRPLEKDQKHLDKAGGRNMPENRNSTRHPSADGAPDSKKQQLDISMDGIYGSEKNTRNMADKMRLAGLPKDAHTKDHKGLIQNAVKFFKENKVLDWKKLQTLPKRIREGAPNQYVGYNKAGIDLADHYDTTPKRVFGMESVLSSEKPPDQSFSMTQRMLKIYRDAGDKVWDKDFTKAAKSFVTPISNAMLTRMRGKGYHDLLDIHEKAMWIKTYDAVNNEPWYRAITPEGRLGDYVRNQDGTRTRMSWNYPDVIGRAILIMEGHVDPVQVVNGHKQGMYNNNKNAPIENNRDYTSDVHDINSSYHDSFSSNSALGKRRYAESYHDRATGDRGSYALHVEAGNQGAKEVGVIPSKFQAGTWTVQQMLRSARRLRSASTEGQAVIDAINNTWKDAQRGKLTRQEARAKVDKLVDDYHDAHGGVRYPDWVRDFDPRHQIDPKELNTIGESYREPAPKEGTPGQPEKLSETRGIPEGSEPGDLGGSAERGLGQRPPRSVSGADPKEDPDRATWYHGTLSGKEIAEGGFKSDKTRTEPAALLYGPGVYFTDDPKIASGYATEGFMAGMPVRLTGGSVVPVHVDVKNPFRAEHVYPWEQAAKIAERIGRPDVARETRASGNYVASQAMSGIKFVEGRTGEELYKAFNTGPEGTRIDKADINKKLQEMGYDGITYEGGKIMDKGPHNVVVAFDPAKQVSFKYAPEQRPPMSATGPVGEPGDAKKRFEAWKEYAGKNKLDVNNMPMFQKWLDTAQSKWVPERGSRGGMAKYNPFAILKRVYESAQRAGQAGFKRGEAEQKEVGDYELAYQAARNKEQLTAQRKAGLDALGELRRQFQNADAWLAADQDKVAKQMTEFVETVLPKDERGAFIKRITAAMRRPPMARGKVSDPTIMHERAFKVMREIEDRAIEVYKRDIIADVKATLNKSLDAPGIDVAYRRRLKQVSNSISLVNPSKKTLAKLQAMQDHIDRATKAGRDPGIPQKHLDELKRLTQLPLKDMPVGALEALQKNIDTMVSLGRMKAKMLKDRWDKTRDDALKELALQPALPLEEREIYTPLPTEKTTVADKFFNSVKRTMNARGFVETALSPMDEIYDHMDGALGTYNGWTSRHYKGQLDLAFNARESEFQPIEQDANELIKRHHLSEADMHIIQMKAIMKMKDVGRQRLEAMGPDPKSPEGARYKALLDKIEAKDFTPGQQEYYDFIRKHYDAIGARISDVAHQLYQIDMLPVADYVPLERDWAAHLKGSEPKPIADPSEGEVPFNETANMDQLQRDVNPLKVSRTKQGFLEERTPEAKTAVKLNAHEVFLRHMRDALHFIHAQPVLKMLGEMTRDEQFKKKYGKMAQNIVLDHLDTIANNGYVDQRHRWRGLDWARNATSKAAVGFRLASGIVHTSQIPLAFVHAGGPHWWLYGLHQAMTREGQLFLRRNAAETFVRGGGEPSQVEAENLAAQKYGAFGRAAFMLPRVIDKFNAQATFLGRYAKEMHDKGIGMDGLLSKPVAADAQALALRRMHRAVASPLAKDVPQILSRGKMFGGNVSIARAVNQFKNIFLDNWSAIRHDILRVGTREARDVIRLMRRGEFKAGVKGVADMATHRAAIAFAMIAGIAIETGIKLYTQQALAAGMHKLTGTAPPPEQSKQEDKKTFLGEFKHHALNRIPFLGQISSAAMYGGTGIPLADALIDVAKEPYLAIAKSKKPETRAKHLVRGASAITTALGIPGSTQAIQLAEPWLSHQLGKVLPAYQSTRTGRPGKHHYGPPGYSSGGHSKHSIGPPGYSHGKSKTHLPGY